MVSKITNLFLGIFLLAGIGGFLFPGKVSAVEYNIQSFYPNDAYLSTHYLYQPRQNAPASHPVDAVFWFEYTDTTKTKWKQYNSDPSHPLGRCHWDLLEWKDGLLLYLETRDECGSTINTTTFNPPIVDMPAIWNEGTEWTYSGQATQSYSEFNQTTQTWDHISDATNVYTNKIHSQQTELAPGSSAIHFQTNQVFTWFSGRFTGGQTHWQEDWYFGPIPILGSSSQTYGLKRTVGGDGFPSSPAM